MTFVGLDAQENPVMQMNQVYQEVAYAISSGNPFNVSDRTHVVHSTSDNTLRHVIGTLNRHKSGFINAYKKVCGR